jgi:hypothetical protein
MPLSGQAKTDYQRDYMRRKRNVRTCSFCDEPRSDDRLLVGDDACCICEQCIVLAATRIREARSR